MFILGCCEKVQLADSGDSMSYATGFNYGKLRDNAGIFTLQPENTFLTTNRLPSIENPFIVAIAFSEFALLVNLTKP